MLFARNTNRRKHWYSLPVLNRKRLMLPFAVFLLFLFSALTVLIVYTWRAMQFDMERVVAHCGASVLYDSEHRPVASLGNEQNEFVPWSQFPQHLVNAFVAREDESFFEHSGVVYSSVLRSALSNILSMRYEQGASTITMQLTRNVYELSDKTLDRKLLEAMLAQRVERHFDKQTIFTQYLNRIYFGQNCYGIGAAARHYFGKPVSALSLPESAALAGLVRAPSLCNPRRSMENAMDVKRETLSRMLAEEMISQQEYDDAVAAPLTLATAEKGTWFNSSYPTMWVGRELDAIRPLLGENTRGMSVVSNLNLSIQQYLEQACERALSAVETPGVFPTAWDSLPEGDETTVANLKKAFRTMRRPAGLKVRGADNDFSGVLQCCALVVDGRRNRRGNVLAVVGGRSAYDGIDRWQGELIPGRTFAPFLFCCACLPGGDDLHIVARNSEVTGLRLGYDVVRSFFDSLNTETELPPREREKDLYNGLFSLRRLTLARLLFDVQNMGRNYKLSLIRDVWSNGQKALYAYEPEKAPEYIRRESAVAVSRLAPFICVEGKPVVLNETLPGNNGQWTMVCNERGVAVFVWMGMDDCGNPVAATPELQRLLSRASLYLAREVHTAAREILRAASAAPDKQQ